MSRLQFLLSQTWCPYRDRECCCLCRCCRRRFTTEAISPYASTPTSGSDFSSWSWASCCRAACFILCTNCTPLACTTLACVCWFSSDALKPLILNVFSSQFFVIFFNFRVRFSMIMAEGQYTYVHGSIHARFSIAPLPSSPTPQS